VYFNEREARSAKTRSPGGFALLSASMQLGALPLRPRYFPPSWREVLGILGEIPFCRSSASTKSMAYISKGAYFLALSQRNQFNDFIQSKLFVFSFVFFLVLFLFSSQFWFAFAFFGLFIAFSHLRTPL